MILFLQHFKCFVLAPGHKFTFSGAFVIDPAQVKYSMYDNPVDFFVVVCLKLFRIALYCIQAYEYISGNSLTFSVIEGNYICIIIVL